MESSPKSPDTYESRDAKRSKISSSIDSPVSEMHFPACSRSWSIVQSSPATPRIGQFRRPRLTSRYRAWNVITRARSPVMPKTTNTSARWAPAGLEPFVADRVRDRTAVLMGGLYDGGDDDWGANPL